MSALLALAAADPKEAVSRARRRLDQNPAPEDRVILLHVLGTALEMRGDLTRALGAFQEAADVATALGDRQTVIDATVSLAGALAAAGRADEAVAELDALGDTGRRAGEVHFQRGLVLARMGRANEAVAELDAAEALLYRDVNTRMRARLYKTRGMLHLSLLDTDGAQRDLEQARRLFGELRDVFEVGITGYNLGLVATARGAPAEALDWFDRSEPTIVEVTGSQLQPGRAEALLAASLYEEAHHEAVRLVRQLRNAGTDRQVAEAQLLAAETALLAGRDDQALDLASKSRAMFFLQSRPAWEGRAMLVELEALDRFGGLERETVEEVIAELTAAGLNTAVARAEAIAARVAARAGSPDQAGTYLDGARSHVQDPPLDIEIDLRSAEVEVRISAGDRGGAGRAAAAGIRAIAARADAMDATDVRNGLQQRATQLARRGLELAIESGDPRRVWAWMEHLRTVALHFRPVQAPLEPGIASLMAELRAITAGAEDATAERQQELAVRRRRVEQELKDRTGPPEHRRIAATAAVVDEGLDRLGERVLIELAEVGHEVWAIFAHDRRVQLFRLGERAEWESAGQSLASTIRRAAFGPQDLATEPLAAVRSQVAGFTGALAAELPHPDGPLVMVPTRALAGIPWGSVFAEHPVVVAPSTASWLTAAASPHRLGRVGTISGPGLDRAPGEATTVGRIHDAEIAEDATRLQALELFERSDTVHVACRGHVQSGQPYFTSLMFADGEIFLHDLASMPQPPPTMVLATRETGFSRRSGAEMLEAAAVLLGCGVRSIVASPWPVPDLGTISPAMVRLHRALGQGMAPAEALRHAAQQQPQAFMLDAFTCFGA